MDGDASRRCGGDFQGQSRMRQYLLHRVPKWGNGDPAADALALQVAEHYCDKIHTFRNERGGPYQAALYSFTFQWTLGRETGALPDGRRAREPLAPGVGAMAGRDRAGITALLHSVSQLDFDRDAQRLRAGHAPAPPLVAGEEGLDARCGPGQDLFRAAGATRSSSTSWMPRRCAPRSENPEALCHAAGARGRL